MSPRIEIDLSESVLKSLQGRQADDGRSLDELVDILLSEALELKRHSLFQVSTSNALVEGVFEGSTTVGDLRSHGDFGLGTFAGLDGEMIMLSGECFRATAAGLVTTAGDDREVPFALVTNFEPDIMDSVESDVSLAELHERIDSLRPSENLFAAIRADGHFVHLSLRAACPARPGEGLVEATTHQSEFEGADVRGSLIGFWSPEYTRAVSVPGYHFHFISDDRSLGGHVLGLRGRELDLEIHTERDLHLALPETAEFLAADLRGEHAEELAKAETRASD